MEKILIITDLEGIIGVLDLNITEVNKRLYLNQMCLVISAIRDIFPKVRITICDIHDKGNISQDLGLSAEDVEYIKGITGLLTADLNYDRALLIGFHGKKGSGGLFDHTFRPEITNIKYGNEDVGEITLFTDWLVLHGVTVVFVSGEYSIVDEVKELDQASIHVVENRLFIRNSKTDIPDLDIDQVYSNLVMGIKSALMKDLLLTSTPADKEIEINFYNPDVLCYLRKKGYDIRNNHLYFPNLIEFFINIHDLSMVLNTFLMKLYRVNTLFLRTIEELKISDDSCDIHVCEITRKSVFEITYADRLLVLRSLGFVK